MGRRDIKAIRRFELIEAAMSAIQKHGFANLTVSQIAEDAETSAGSIHYYFGGKDALLEATMRHLLAVLKEAVLRRLSSLEDPEQRLIAVVLGNFDETLFSSESCSVWTQFWAYAPYNPRLARLQLVNKSRVRSNLIAELKRLMSPDAAETACIAIQSYMDGIWVHAAQTGTPPPHKQVQDDATHFLLMLTRGETPRRPPRASEPSR